MMETLLTDSPLVAAEIIRSGGLVAFPTETVYGLGASVFNEGAVGSIFEAKRRPADNPLIAHIASIGQIELLAAEVTPSAKLLIGAFFPGPLTVVLRKTSKVPLIATAGLDTIGIRMPGSAVAHEFLLACGAPVVAPSANLSGRPSPTTWQAVNEDLNGRIDCILRGDATEIGLESTVVDCTGSVPVILRAGSVSIDQIRAVVPDAVAFDAGAVGVLRSPGLKHRHYSPKATVVLVDHIGSEVVVGKAAFIGLEDTHVPFAVKRICRDVEEYAHSIFEFLRECDREGILTVYCQTVPELGIGTALMDRLRRASEG